MRPCQSNPGCSTASIHIATPRIAQFRFSFSRVTPPIWTLPEVCNLQYDEAVLPLRHMKGLRASGRGPGGPGFCFPLGVWAFPVFLVWGFRVVVHVVIHVVIHWNSNGLQMKVCGSRDLQIVFGACNRSRGGCAA